MAYVTIGQAAAATGVAVETIRYYEKIELLPRGNDRPGTHRRYDAATMRRLAFIGRARDLGFKVDAIRELLTLAERERSAPGENRETSRAILVAIKARITLLETLELELIRLSERLKNGERAEFRLASLLPVEDEHCRPEEPGNGRRIG